MEAERILKEKLEIFVEINLRRAVLQVKEDLHAGF